MSRGWSLSFQALYHRAPDTHRLVSWKTKASTRLGERRQHVGAALRVKSWTTTSDCRGTVTCMLFSKKKKSEEKMPKHDWEGLIQEFEFRAASSEFPSAPPPRGVILGKENPEEFELLPIVETAACTALTFVMWYLGRIFRLDSFLLLFYPIPMFFITMRWGPKTGDRVLWSTLLLVLTMMGPLYSILYFFNTGIMAMVFSRVLWHRWHWFPSVIAGGIGKGVGLTIQFTWMSTILRHNSWEFITEQVKGMLDAVFGACCGVLKIQNVPTLSLHQIQIAVVVVLVLHSVLHVLFSYLASTMLLDRLADAVVLKRRPRILRVLQLLKDRVQRESYRQY